MSHTASLGISTVHSGEIAAIYTPRSPRANKYGAVLLHGAATPMQFMGTTWPNSGRLAAALANAGVCAVAPMDTATPLTATDLWATDAHMTRITESLAALGALGCDPAKAHLIGGSMGAAAAFRFAALNPTKVASLQLIIPALSLKNHYAQNPGSAIVGGFTAGIATAWGKTYRTVTDAVFNGTTTVTSATGFTAADVGRIVVTNTAVIQSMGTPKVPFNTTIVSQSGTSAVMSAAASVSSSGNAVGFADPLPTSGSPNADLLALAPAIASAGIPTRAFYSTIDPYIQVADVTAGMTAAGGTAIALDSTFGHTNGTFGTWATYNGGSEFSDLITVIKANGG